MDISSLLCCIFSDSRIALRSESPSCQPIVYRKPRPTAPPQWQISTPDSFDATVAKVVNILRSADERGFTLSKQIDDAIGVEGWTEWVAERVLEVIEGVLKEGREKMAQAMVEAYDKASEAANAVFHFAKDHPVITAVLLTIIAIGVLTILAPVIVEALGFAELGPVEGITSNSSYIHFTV
ncbi:hypothetical protein JX265_011304 [Neoarthrinium moseri]|uniref:Uncharacterized protein n=1 Tax=Neoarthrinium moseri TaxID=1658444 RepID=A0A9P9WCF6_9PEZI|nr:hypothetical protein JX265_011304 [Neoarthrinium moseri]